MKNYLILCCGHPLMSDMGFGFHIFKALEKKNLPQNIDIMEVGFSACMIPHIIEQKDKLIVVDVFLHSKDEPGTIMRLKPEELHLKIDLKKDPAKVHLIETLEQMHLTGYCPETIFIGIVPKEYKTESEQLSPEIESKIPTVLEMIMKEIEL